MAAALAGANLFISDAVQITGTGAYVDSANIAHGLGVAPMPPVVCAVAGATDDEVGQFSVRVKSYDATNVVISAIGTNLKKQSFRVRAERPHSGLI